MSNWRRMHSIGFVLPFQGNGCRGRTLDRGRRPRLCCFRPPGEALLLKKQVAHTKNAALTLAASGTPTSLMPASIRKPPSRLVNRAGRGASEKLFAVPKYLAVWQYLLEFPYFFLADWCVSQIQLFQIRQIFQLRKVTDLSALQVYPFYVTEIR